MASSRRFCLASASPREWCASAICVITIRGARLKLQHLGKLRNRLVQPALLRQHRADGLVRRRVIRVQAQRVGRVDQRVVQLSLVLQRHRQVLVRLLEAGGQPHRFGELRGGVGEPPLPAQCRAQVVVCLRDGRLPPRAAAAVVLRECFIGRPAARSAWSAR